MTIICVGRYNIVLVKFGSTVLVGSQIHILEIRLWILGTALITYDFDISSCKYKKVINVNIDRGAAETLSPDKSLQLDKNK